MTIVLALGFSLLITMLPFVAFAVLAITDQDDKVAAKTAFTTNSLTLQSIVANE